MPAFLSCNRYKQMPQSLVEEPVLETKNYSSLESAGLCGPRLGHFRERPFTVLFEEQVESDSAKVAVKCGEATLSFAELNARANQLARHLQLLGVDGESIVGICIDRSLEMAIGILGILKSGGAYLPLDPDYPAERLAFMVEDARPSVIVTKAKLAELITAESSQFVLLDNDWSRIAEQSSENLSAHPSPAHLAYVIYTSGSTGAPKGVMIEHGNLSNYLLALDREIGVRNDDVYLHLASIAFSSSRRQLMLPLSQGATVMIASDEERKDPLVLFAAIKQTEVTLMDAVPSFWRNCTAILVEMDEDARAALLDNKVRLMLSASEPLPADIPRTWIREFNHRARHVHMFGQTETAGIVSVNSNPDIDSSDRVSIGHSIANTEILLLDDEMKPCAVGVSGELYIGGAGVGRGYLNRPDLTAEKFVPHLFKAGERLYRTGDWARLSENGQLEFAGRHDQQIKLRGFRVELGEVEAALAKHPSIREAAVIARDHAGTKLVAYFVANEELPDAGELREFLGKHLPDYAIPSAFVPMDALPLSANGKIDRLILSQTDLPRLVLSSDYRAAQTKVEVEVAQIWISLLRVERVGVDDNFFALGGDSLLAGQAIVRVRDRFKVEAPVTWLFESPTVGELATRVESALAKGEVNATQALVRVSREQPLPLSFSQQRLWFLDQLEPDSSAYNLAYATEIEGPLVTDALRKSLNAIVARHEVLRTRFISIDGSPLQHIDQTTEAEWRLINLEDLPAEERAREAARLIEDEARQPFDLSTGPLLRAMLVRVGAGNHLMLLTMHHIVSDAWSAGVFAQELSEFYRAFAAGEEPSLPDLPLQYADFAVWQHQRFADGALDSQINYWRQQLADAPAVLSLPTDFPRTTEQSYRGAKETVRVPAKLMDGLHRLARTYDATMFMVLLAAFKLQIALYSGQRDIVIGSPIAGRDEIDTEPLIGFFVNTLAFRTLVSPQLTVAELIASVRETAVSAYANQHVPFEKLVELQNERSLDHNSIFQVMFAMQNGEPFRPRLTGLRLTQMRPPVESSKFDLSMDAIANEEGLNIAVCYSTDLYRSESARQILADYQLLLTQFVANPEQRFDEMPKLSWTPQFLPPKATAATKAALGFVSSSTPIQEKLVSIWQEVLDLDNVGVEDNFFALGGHSLMATQVIARIRNAFDYELPLRKLFEAPTISALANVISENQTGKTGDDELAALLAELEGLSDEEAQNQLTLENAA